eukprot:5014610-Amphidinium_carterae.1
MELRYTSWIAQYGLDHHTRSSWVDMWEGRITNACFNPDTTRSGRWIKTPLVEDVDTDGSSSSGSVDSTSSCDADHHDDSAAPRVEIDSSGLFLAAHVSTATIHKVDSADSTTTICGSLRSARSYATSVLHDAGEGLLCHKCFGTDSTVARVDRPVFA